MSSIWLLMGLCLLSYVGSFLVGRRAFGGGLPAGTEYVMLGFVLGPSALGVVERSLLVTFEPVAHAALGWLAFVLGLQYGVNDGRRVRFKRMVGSWVAFAITASAVGGATYLALSLGACEGAPSRGLGAFCVAGLGVRERLLLAGAIAVSTAETTRFAVRWVVHHGRATGTVAQLVGDLADSDDLAPLLAVAALFAFAPNGDIALGERLRGGAAQTVLPWTWFALTLALGGLLGGISAVLLGRTFRVAEAWSLLLGMAMLAIGTASRLGLASITAMFVMGAAISGLSRHREDVVAIVVPTERAVMLPALLLAGASVDFASSKWLAWLLPVAILARLAAKVLVGFGILAVSPRARPAGPLLGLGLTSSGALSMTIGLAFSLRFPGAIGGAALAAAAIATVVGEGIGPPLLRACLRRAGEIHTEAPPPSDLPSEGGEQASIVEEASHDGASGVSRSRPPSEAPQA